VIFQGAGASARVALDAHFQEPLGGGEAPEPAPDEAEGNNKAQHGYSRDQRPDCKQVNIGLVVTPEGLPIGYEVFAGHTADVTTVEAMVAMQLVSSSHRTTLPTSQTKGSYVEPVRTSAIKHWSGIVGKKDGHERRISPPCPKLACYELGS